MKIETRQIQLIIKAYNIQKNTIEQYKFMPSFKPNIVPPAAYFTFPSATRRLYSLFFLLSLPFQII